MDLVSFLLRSNIAFPTKFFCKLCLRFLCKYSRGVRNCVYQGVRNVSFAEDFCSRIVERIKINGNINTKWVIDKNVDLLFADGSNYFSPDITNLFSQI